MNYTFAPSPELAYWTARGHTREDVEKVFTELASHEHFARLEVKPDGRMSMHGSDEINHYYYQLSVAMLSAALMLVPPPKPGVVLIGHHDAIWKPLHLPVPILGFCKRKDDDRTVMVPDPHFISTDGYDEYRDAATELAKLWPWEKKRPTAFWRGVTTGYPLLTPETWEQNPRVQLVALAKRVADPELLDASLTAVEQSHDAAVSKAIHDLGYVTPTVSPKVFYEYKYIVNIDGNASAWGLFWKFLFRSVVLMVEGNFEQWYQKPMRAWEHYIPVKRDLSDLVEKIEWARAHDAECKAIADRAYDIVASITRESACWEVGKILEALLRSQR